MKYRWRFMTLFKQLNKEQLKEILVKCWMTHDGLWFLHAYLNCGIKMANRLNKSAIKSLSQIECARIQKALGKKNEKIDSFEKLKLFIDDAFSLLKGDFMKFEYSFPRENVIHWEIHECFAYEGMKKIGVSAQYNCGVLYRVKCWLDALKIKYSMTPKIRGCLMASEGKCAGDFNVYFESSK